jgi:hypothetical protein
VPRSGQALWRARPYGGPFQRLNPSLFLRSIPQRPAFRERGAERRVERRSSGPLRWRVHSIACNCELRIVNCE